METHRSFWSESEPARPRPELGGDLDVDVLVIGAGITGVTTAYLLAREGIRVALIEADGVADGVTGSTTGKVSIQHRLIYTKLAKRHGRETAAAYGRAQT